MEIIERVSMMDVRNSRATKIFYAVKTLVDTRPSSSLVDLCASIAWDGG
ncbi:MAG: hypothetical protein QOD00_2929 [Blastocatellia bacterium]|jgi:hypothetical protein|nr:hypothetical protein [Blastocatellia bacterium]